MKRSISLLALAAIIITSMGIATGASMAPKSASANLKAEHGSKESGTATLSAVGAKTKVVVSVSGEPAGASQPAHIHSGKCNPDSALGGVVYPLSNVVGGKSTTWISAPLATVLSKGTVINIHKSKTEIAKYVACGTIK
jgi:hypothetical protein